MSTVKEVLDRGNIADLGPALQQLKIGTLLDKMCTPVLETVTVTSHVGILSAKAMGGMIVHATTANTAGDKDVILDVAAAGTGKVLLGTDGKTLTFDAGDAVTVAKVYYTPLPAEAALLAATYADFPG